MSPRPLRISLTAAALFAGASSAFGLIGPVLPGTTDFDGWDNLSITNPQVASTTAPFPFPGFPGAAPWPTAIDSVLTQGTTDIADDDPTGDAGFIKTAGNGYPASTTIYSSPFANGTYSVSDTTPVPGLETVLFQIEIGEGSAGFLDATPTLTVNGTTAVPLFEGGVQSIVDAPNPFSGPGASDATLNLATLGYQWDVSGLGPISSFDVAFTTAGTSTTIFQLQLDQGDTFAAVSGIPEPTSAVAVAWVGTLMLCGRRN